MAKRKQKTVVVEEDETLEVPAEISCPQHPRHQLTVVKDGNMAYAICDCNVRNNMWKGQRVWEATPPRRQKIVVEESDNG